MIEVDEVPTMTLEQWAETYGINIAVKWDKNSFTARADRLRMLHNEMETYVVVGGETSGIALDLFGRIVSGSDSLVLRTESGVKHLPVTRILRNRKWTTEEKVLGAKATLSKIAENTSHAPMTLAQAIDTISRINEVAKATLADID